MEFWFINRKIDQLDCINQSKENKNCNLAHVLAIPESSCEIPLRRPKVMILTILENFPHNFRSTNLWQVLLQTAQPRSRTTLRSLLNEQLA